ncbi:hypothetical protein DSL92_08955 [Billgrantia gudaonensis]|uniref:Uncharacterized protein n=1 Tax=Billgrantia gudaonensis TaxID=376427 RepID=A0A3S0QFH3_9GAMM|nr:hypothetical protein DSL92_08955 [Halomonas gudaonensis]
MLSGVRPLAGAGARGGLSRRGSDPPLSLSLVLVPAESATAAPQPDSGRPFAFRRDVIRSPRNASPMVPGCGAANCSTIFPTWMRPRRPAAWPSD